MLEMIVSEMWEVARKWRSSYGAYNVSSPYCMEISLRIIFILDRGTDLFDKLRAEYIRDKLLRYGCGTFGEEVTEFLGSTCHCHVE